MAFRSAETLEVDLLRHVSGRIALVPIPGFELVQIDSSVEKLPDLSGLVLRSVAVDGHLSAKGDRWKTAKDIISHRLSDDNDVMFSCGFQETSSKQSLRIGYDTVSIRVRSGSAEFAYDANGSKVASDAAYARLAISRLVGLSGLPLALRIFPDGYMLEHSSGGSIQITGSGLGGRNPSSFWCELPGETMDGAISRMKLAVDSMSSKVLAYNWSVSNGGSDVQNDVYRALCEQPFEAERFDGNRSGVVLRSC